MITSFNYHGKTYFLLVFIGTLTCWSIGGLMSFSADWADLYMLPMLLGLMMPAIIAITMIYQQPVAAMKQDFKQRLFHIGHLRPFAFAGSLTIMPLSVVFAIALSVAFGGSVEQFRVSEAFSFQTGFIPVLGLLLLAAIFEELGWRGYGFESLEEGRSFFTASVVFGVLWSLWHLPLLWVNHSYQYEIYHQNPWYAVNFFLSTAILGIVVSWVCHINHRSILAAIIFHFVVNLSQEGLSMTQETKIIQTFVLLGFVIIIIMRDSATFYKARQHKTA